MIYFDNSASAFFKPECVINAVTNALRFLPANPGRSGHSAAVRGAALVLKTREKCAALVGLPRADGIIFTANCTEAINLAIMGTAKRGGHIVTTAFEHNAVLRSLYALRHRYGVKISVAMPDEHGVITAHAVERLMRPDTYLAVVNHVSNVTGAIAPIESIGKLCRRRGILLLADCAQSAGYCDLDMEKQCVDMLAVAPHKGLHAPQGVGFLAVGERVTLSPLRFGGTGTSSSRLAQPADMPDGFEAGTLPTPAIAGLAAAIGWSERHKLWCRDKIFSLSARLRRGLNAMERVRVLSPESALGGIIAFNVEGMGSESVADILSAQYDICVRAGLHCAPLIHERMGTLSTGAVRVSLGCDNTEAEVDFFLKALAEIARR